MQNFGAFYLVSAGYCVRWKGFFWILRAFISELSSRTVHDKLPIFLLTSVGNNPTDTSRKIGNLSWTVLEDNSEINRASRLKKSGEWQITRLKWRFQTSERFVKLKKKTSARGATITLSARGRHFNTTTRYCFIFTRSIPSFKAWKSFHRPNTFVLIHYDVQ